jgi:signal transduction histidine kinase
MATALLTGGFRVEGFPTVMFLSVNIFAPAAIVAAIGAFDREVVKNLDRLRGAVDQVRFQRAALDQRQWVEQQRLARFVHSDLQARLRAFALRIDLTGRLPTDAEIEDLKKECDRSLATEGQQKDFEAFMGSAIELWDRAMRVELAISDVARSALRQDPYASAAAIEVCREALSNASKHGGSTFARVQVSLTLTERTELLAIEVSDNGNSKNSDSAGLGSQSFNELCLSWNIDISEQGAKLKARLPIQFGRGPVQETT